MAKTLNEIKETIKKSCGAKYIVGFDDYDYAFDALIKSLNINKNEIFEIDEKNLYQKLPENIKALIIGYKNSDFNQEIPEKIKQSWRLSMEYDLKLI